MTVILIFVVGVVMLSLIWLLREGVLAKPWLDTGLGDVGPADAVDAGGTGLIVFLAVVGALFALFGSAFVMRMDIEAWSAFSLPPIVWANTLWLILASLFLHLSARAGWDSDRPAIYRDLALAGLATLGFLTGQILAWRDIWLAGGSLTSGPASSFFYVLSGLHGLHIIGGLTALAAVAVRVVEDARATAGIALCARYWDFMLVIWLGLLALFLGWANRIVDICRTVLT